MTFVSFFLTFLYFENLSLNHEQGINLSFEAILKLTLSPSKFMFVIS